MSSPALPFSLPPPAAGKVDLLVIAGEHSGDEHAAPVVREALARDPGLRACALGGRSLESAGAQLLHDLTATSVVGFVEVLKHYSFFRALFEATVAWIRRNRPRSVCLVDYPGFNLRLAARLREEGLSVRGGGSVRVVYYISPQIWAWKAKRRFAMARDIDALAVIFPFEPECYADTNLPVEFVGHPFLDPGYNAPVRADPAGPILLLPGSRVQAVERIFPALLEGFAKFRRERADAQAMVLYPSEKVAAILRAEIGRRPAIAGAVVPAPVRTGSEAAMAASAVLTSSGTMSLHCALAGIPGAIAYRTNPLTYLLARWWVKLDFIGIANLLLKEPMYPEYIQGAATPASLAAELVACAGDPARRERTRLQASRLRKMLHQAGGTSAADWLVRQLAAS